jgi:hypothetical protein
LGSTFKPIPEGRYQPAQAGVLTQAQANALLGPGNILLQGLTVEFGG